MCTSSFLASTPATWNTWWVIAATGALSSSTECSTSLRRNRLTSLSTPLSSVAENSMPLATRRGGGQDPGDAGQEAEVGHVIGFVDHGDLDGVEADQALLHQVLEPARAGDDDVDAGS